MNDPTEWELHSDITESMVYDRDKKTIATEKLAQRVVELAKIMKTALEDARTNNGIELDGVGIDMQVGISATGNLKVVSGTASASITLHFGD